MERGWWEVFSLTQLQAVPSAIVVMDTEGHIVALNTAAEQLLNTTGEQAIGLPYSQVFGPSLAERVFGLFLRVARSRDPAKALLIRATLPNGHRAVLRASAGPIVDRAGQNTGILFAAEHTTSDNAELRQHEEDVAKTQRLRQALQRYLGDVLAATVEARPSFIGIGGKRHVITVLHADVRGYTTLAEAMEPEEVFHMLLRYHGAAVGSLRAKGATLDRFIGDAILAFWNAPTPQDEHPRMALQAALALQGAVKAAGTELGYGLGLHTGEAVVGNLGGDQYMAYTAIGDTVNVAARLQAAAAAGEVVCSAAAVAAAGPGVRAVFLGPLAVKGRKSPVEAYRLEGIDP